MKDKITTLDAIEVRLLLDAIEIRLYDPDEIFADDAICIFADCEGDGDCDECEHTGFCVNTYKAKNIHVVTSNGKRILLIGIPELYDISPNRDHFYRMDYEMKKKLKE